MSISASREGADIAFTVPTSTGLIQFLQLVKESAVGRAHHYIQVAETTKEPLRSAKSQVLRRAKCFLWLLVRNHVLSVCGLPIERGPENVVVTLRVGGDDAFAVAITMIDNTGHCH